MSKKIISLILSVLMIVCMMPTSMFSAFAAEHVHKDADKNNVCDDSSCRKNLYVERSWDDEAKEVKTILKELPANPNTIDTTLKAGGWYIINGIMSNSNRIIVNGTSENPTHIILKDGSTFRANKGIEVAEGSALCIYGQAKDSGKLIATGEEQFPGIGGGDCISCGTVTVYGGTVEATGGMGAAGIGGRTFTMYGGNVTAYGSDGEAAIGYGDFAMNCEGVIKAGDSAPGTIVSVSDYAKNRRTYVNIKSHKHNFTGEYRIDEGTHSQKCSVTNEFEDPTEHNYGDDGYCECGDFSIAVYAIIAEGKISAAQSDLTLSIATDAIKRLEEIRKSNDASLKEKVDRIVRDTLDYMASIDLENAKQNAIAELNAAKTEANTKVVDGAISEISAVTTIEAINPIMEKALEDMYAADLAAAIYNAIMAVEAAKSNAISDKAKDVVTNTIDSLETLEAVENEKNKLLNDIAGFDTELANAKQTAIDEINAAKNEVNASVANEAIEEINALTSDKNIEGIKDRALWEMSVLDLEKAKQDAIAELNVAKTEANAEIADRAIESVTYASSIETINEIMESALAKMYEADFAKAMWDAFNEIDTAKANAISDKAKAVSSSSISQQETIEAVISEKTKILNEIAGYETELADAKQAAIDELNAAKTKENADVVNQAIEDINALTSEEYIDSIKEWAFVNMYALDLAKAKQDAIAEIEAAKRDAKSDEAKEVSSEIIESLETLETVEFNKTKILNVIADAERALEEAKQVAIDELDAAKTEANESVVNKAIEDINALTSVEAVYKLKQKAIADMYAADLAKAKEDAIAEIETAKKDAKSDEAKNESSAVIETLETIEDVEFNKTKILNEIAGYEAELADAKQAAIDELDAAKTEANESVANKAIEDINALTSVEEVCKLKQKAIAAMYAADLAKAKEDAIAEIEEAKEAVYSGDAKAVSTASIAPLETIEEVEEEKNNILDIIAGLEQELLEIKEVAIDEIDRFTTNANADIAEEAVNSIMLAASEDEVNAIVQKATEDMLSADPVLSAKYNAYNEITVALDGLKHPYAKTYDFIWLAFTEKIELIKLKKNEDLKMIDSWKKAIENPPEINIGENTKIKVGDNQMGLFQFAPKKSGVYSVYVSSEYVSIFDSDFNEIEYIENSDNQNVSAELSEGDAYYIGVYKEMYPTDISFEANVLLSVVDVDCDHLNTVYVPEKSNSCTEEGYTAATYCSDCGMLLSGHKMIPKHFDEDNDFKCDVCGEWIDENIGIYNAIIEAMKEIENIVASSTSPIKYELFSLFEFITPLLNSVDIDDVESNKNYIISVIEAYENDFLNAWNNATEINVGETITTQWNENIYSVLKFTPEHNGVYRLGFESWFDIYRYDSQMNMVKRIGSSESMGDELTKGETVYYCIANNGRTFSGELEVTLIQNEEICDHINTIVDAGKEPDCTEEGFTAGIYCNDCTSWISGHEVVAKKHIDKNNDHICDACGNEILVASGEYGDNVIWKLYEDGTLEISGTGEMIYDETYPFEPYLSQIKKVVIGEGVTSICNLAFVNCTNLKEVELPDSLVNIGYAAFDTCIRLKTITIPDSVKYMDSNAFIHCISLENVNIGSGLEGIEYNTFRDCMSLKTIVIPENVEFIGEEAFRDCYSLTNVTILNPNCELSNDEGYCIFENEYIIIVPIEPFVENCIKYYDFMISTMYVTVDNVDWATILELSERQVMYAKSENGMLPSITLYGFKNSTTEEYADDWNITFSVIGEDVSALKAQAIAEIQAAMSNAKSDEAKNISLDPVNNAVNSEEVENAKNEILSAIANAEKALADAKAAAIAEINNAKTEANKTIAENAIADINAATTVENVTAIKTKALTDMAKADEDAAAAKVLAEAKTAAVTAINNAKTEANKAIAEKAIADINAATTVDTVKSIKTKALSDMAKADEDAAAAKALAEAKTAAIAEVKANLTSDSTDVEKALVDEAVKAVENAKSIAEVKNAKSDFVEKWKELHTQEDPTDPDEPSNTCNHMCHKGGFMGFIWKIVRFFCKLFGTNKVCKCGAAHY